MTHDPHAGPDVRPDASYRNALILALRLKDVPGERIGELVAEVESHVADTGEDPVEAFGPAREYAASVSVEHRQPLRWDTIVTAGCAFVAGWFLAQGALALLLGRTYLDVPGWVWLLVGAAVAVPAAVRVRRRADPVRDPRTGASLTPTPWWATLALVALPVGTVLLAYAAIRLFG